MHPGPEALDALQCRDVQRHGQRGVDDRGVREHPARRDVPLLRRAVAGQPQLAHHGQLAAPADLVQLRGAAPRVGPRGRAGGGDDRRELLQGPVQLALGVQLPFECVAQLDQHLDVQSGVAQPRLGQRTGGPVHRRVLLGQAQPEHVLGHRSEADPGEAGDPAGQLGVEQSLRSHADLGQAGQVLGGGVHHPFGVREGRAQPAEVGAGDRVDQRGPGARAA